MIINGYGKIENSAEKQSDSLRDIPPLIIGHYCHFMSIFLSLPIFIMGYYQFFYVLFCHYPSFLYVSSLLILIIQIYDLIYEEIKQEVSVDSSNVSAYLTRVAGLSRNPDRFGCNSLDAHLHRPGSADDPGAGDVLRRTCQNEKRPGNNNAQFCCNGNNKCSLGDSRIQHVLRRKRAGRCDWMEPRLPLSKRYRHQCNGRRDSRVCLFNVPGKIRHNNPCTDCRSLCGKDNIQIILLVYSPLEHICLQPALPLGMVGRRISV